LRDQALAHCSSARAHELEFRATSLSTLVQMVAGGAGVTLLPELAVPTEARRAQISLRPFAAPGPGRTLALVWRKRSALGPALRRIAAVARAAYGRAARPSAGGASRTLNPGSGRRPSGSASGAAKSTTRRTPGGAPAA
jgi:LysR family hydrogen peroxide-inducible transcriptional activator